jgi:hypothetical protein
VATSLGPFTPCRIPKSLVKGPTAFHRPPALFLLKEPLVFSPPAEGGAGGRFLSHGRQPVGQEQKERSRVPAGGARFTIKESAIKQTWPGQSEKYVTVFVNGSAIDACADEATAWETWHGHPRLPESQRYGGQVAHGASRATPAAWSHIRTHARGGFSAPQRAQALFHCPSNEQ